MTTRERISALLLLLVAAFLLFYNLNLNPRPWQDEGAMLTLAKTLVREGVYAVRSGNSYQSFGAVQSVGPTVILPVALSFKVLGIGFWQGRWVIGLYSIIALIALFRATQTLFNARAAFIAVVFLFSATGSVYVLWSRQVLGEIPALAFFWLGWLCWARSTATRQTWRAVLGGVLMGLAMVTKSQYVLLAGGAIAITLILDLLYFKQRQTLNLMVLGAAALACVAAWTLAQYLYFGPITFAENTAKLQMLARASSGLNLLATREALRALLGTGNGHLYPFWGFPALLFALIFALRKNGAGLITFLPVVSAWLWLGYYIFWSIHWSSNLIFPTSVAVIFIGQLAQELLHLLAIGWRAARVNIRQTIGHNQTLTTPTLAWVATAALLVVLAAWTVDELQTTLRQDVLDKTGESQRQFPHMGLLQAPRQLTDYLNTNVPRDALIETWERELGVLTEHRYHYLDQSALARSQVAVRGGSRDYAGYAFGQAYFESVQPAYLVIGRYARVAKIYDAAYLAAHANLVFTVGDDETRYEVYQLR